MQKTLLLLRHAQAIPDHGSCPDHDRPLTDRGRAEAERMGRFLAEQRLLPDLVVSSTALRAQTTADLVARVAQLTASQVSERELYLAPPGAYLESASRLPDAVARPLWVGHNPGLEDLVHVLTGRSEELPTAALVVISLELSRWSELGPDVRGTLVRVVRPRALDAG